MIARRAIRENTNSPGIRFGFPPPRREPSPGALPALLAVVVGFAVVLAAGAALDAASHSTRTVIHLPSGAGLQP